MPEMIRLRELAALLKPPVAPVQEAKTKASDFEGIQNVVQDALDDLHDKLAEGGALEALVDSVGLTNLDKQKDKDGFTILERLDHITAQYKKEVQKLMMEIEGMMISMPVHEMASAREFNSGAWKSDSAKNRVAQFRGGEETFDLSNGDKYEAVGPVSGSALKAGDIVLASYSSTNQGAQLYQVIGFTGDDAKYGEGGVKFKSAKEMLDHYKVTSLKALHDLQDKNEYGKHSYLVVKDLDDGDEGPWFYIYKGRWARGSGAEQLTFTKAKKI